MYATELLPSALNVNVKKLFLHVDTQSIFIAPIRSCIGYAIVRTNGIRISLSIRVWLNPKLSRGTPQTRFLHRRLCTANFNYNQGKDATGLWIFVWILTGRQARISWSKISWNNFGLQTDLESTHCIVRLAKRASYTLVVVRRMVKT